MSVVVGIDQSSVAIDLVRLDENRDHATHWHIPLGGATAFARLQTVQISMPTRSWWDDVYLAAIEIPESRFRASLRAQLPIVGAVIACIPSVTPVWDVTPADWKKPLGIPGNTKPTAENFPGFDLTGWPQDGLDALGVALYARELNATALQPPVTRNREAA